MLRASPLLLVCTLILCAGTTFVAALLQIKKTHHHRRTSHSHSTKKQHLADADDEIIAGASITKHLSCRDAANDEDAGYEDVGDDEDAGGDEVTGGEEDTGSDGNVGNDYEDSGNDPWKTTKILESTKVFLQDVGDDEDDAYAGVGASGEITDSSKRHFSEALTKHHSSKHHFSEKHTIDANAAAGVRSNAVAKRFADEDARVVASGRHRAAEGAEHIASAARRHLHIHHSSLHADRTDKAAEDSDSRIVADNNVKKQSSSTGIAVGRLSIVKAFAEQVDSEYDNIDTNDEDVVVSSSEGISGKGSNQTHHKKVHHSKKKAQTNYSLCERHAETSCSDRMRVLCPSAMIIGTNHGGSTTIEQLLDMHPQLHPGEHPCGTEHRFFANGLNTTSCKANRTVANYAHEFRVPCDVRFTFDKSPQTMLLGNPELDPSIAVRCRPGVECVKEVYETLGPDVKFILSIRDPLKWLSSNNAMQKSPMIKLSCWADSLTTWLQIFPAKQFLFLDAETMFASLNATANRLYTFLGVPFLADVRTIAAGRRRNKGSIIHDYRAAFWSDSYNRNCKTRLENMTGLVFEWEGSV